MLKIIQQFSSVACLRLLMFISLSFATLMEIYFVKYLFAPLMKIFGKEIPDLW